MSRMAMFFRPQGAPMSAAWAVSGASWLQDSSLSSLGVNTSEVRFNGDGTKMYVLEGGGIITQYSLSTAWNSNSKTFAGSFATGLTVSEGMYIKPNGTSVYISTGNGTSVIQQRNFGTAWDITTLGNANNTVVGAQETYPYCLWFKPDGTKVYLIGFTNKTIYEYSLGTAWLFSTISYTSNSFSVAASTTYPLSIQIKDDDGLQLIIANYQSASINQVRLYDFGTAWTLSTLSHNSTIDISAKETVIRGATIGKNSAKLYVIGDTKKINEYDL